VQGIGLKPETGRGPVEALVIDTVDWLVGVLDERSD
jgi:hypothetical protein